MALKLKNHEISINIIKLVGRENHKTWRDSFIRFMGTMKIKWMLGFKVSGIHMALDLPEMMEEDVEIQRQLENN